MGRVILAWKSDEEETRAARAAAFAYSLHTDWRCFCSCDCVGIRSEHTGAAIWATPNAPILGEDGPSVDEWLPPWPAPDMGEGSASSAPD